MKNNFDFRWHMKFISTTFLLLTLLVSSLFADDKADGLANEKTDINAKDTSQQDEKKLPDLKKPIIHIAPKKLNDGIPVGTLAASGCDQQMIIKLVEQITTNKYKNIDSLLISHKRKLVLECYFKKGRLDVPHYQMSITKSITALALGRAIQMGYLKDVNTPIVDYLKDVDQSKLVPGATKLTIAECLNMHSGIRIPNEKAKKARRQRRKLKGQGQAQMVLSLSAPITKESKEYKYQGTDPSLVMQVIEAVVPGTAEEFIKKEVLGKLGISNYRWQPDVSGLPKAAAGSSIRSRDMLKFGMLIAQKGKWNNRQLWSKDFIQDATKPIYTNKAGDTYGYFWWGSNMKAGGKSHRCISARGAGGQFIMIIPSLELIVVATSHNKGGEMRFPLRFTPEYILPAFVDSEK